LTSQDLEVEMVKTLSLQIFGQVKSTPARLAPDENRYYRKAWIKPRKKGLGLWRVTHTCTQAHAFRGVGFVIEGP
jgi:hypothetical protein